MNRFYIMQGSISLKTILRSILLRAIPGNSASYDYSWWICSTSTIWRWNINYYSLVYKNGAIVRKTVFKRNDYLISFHFVPQPCDLGRTRTQAAPVLLELTRDPLNYTRVCKESNGLCRTFDRLTTIHTTALLYTNAQRTIYNITAISRVGLELCIIT